MPGERQQRSGFSEKSTATLRSDKPEHEGLHLPTFLETRKRLGVLAAAVVGVGGVSSWVMSGQVEAVKDECTDAAHQQVVAEAGFRATVRSISDDKRLDIDQVAEQLSEQRGYHISGPQIAQANQSSDVLADGEFTSGVHCIDVPGPVYAGFYATEADDSLQSVASDHGIGVKALRRFNPPLQEQPAKESLEAGLTLRVSKQIDTRYVYREMTKEESDIATIAVGKPKLRQKLLEHNDSLVSTGESIEADTEAWLPLRMTEWLKDENMTLKNIKTAHRPDLYQAILKRELAGEVISNENGIIGAMNRASSGVSRSISVRSTEQLAERGPEWHRRAKAMRFFIDSGLKDYQAAGLIGNFVVETGDNKLPPAIKQYGGGPGRGIAQWEAGARFEDLKQFARRHDSSWDNFDTQLAFVMHEFKTTEKEAFEWLRKTKNVKQAANAVLNGYERPAARILQPRYDAAHDILNAYRTHIRYEA